MDTTPTTIPIPDKIQLVIEHMQRKNNAINKLEDFKTLVEKINSIKGLADKYKDFTFEAPQITVESLQEDLKLQIAKTEAMQAVARHLTQHLLKTLLEYLKNGGMLSHDTIRTHLKIAQSFDGIAEFQPLIHTINQMLDGNTTAAAAYETETTYLIACPACGNHTHVDKQTNTGICESCQTEFVI